MMIEKYPFNKSSIRVATARDFFPVLKTFVVPIFPDPISLISFLKKFLLKLIQKEQILKDKNTQQLLLNLYPLVRVN